MYTITFTTDAGIQLLVNFEIRGKYYPATMWQPEELPDPDIISVTRLGGQEAPFGQDLYDTLSDSEQSRLDKEVFNSQEYKDHVYQ